MYRTHFFIVTGILWLLPVLPHNIGWSVSLVETKQELRRQAAQRISAFNWAGWPAVRRRFRIMKMSSNFTLFSVKTNKQQTNKQTLWRAVITQNSKKPMHLRHWSTYAFVFAYLCFRSYAVLWWNNQLDCVQFKGPWIFWIPTEAWKQKFTFVGSLTSYASVVLQVIQSDTGNSLNSYGSMKAEVQNSAGTLISYASCTSYTVKYRLTILPYPRL